MPPRPIWRPTCRSSCGAARWPPIIGSFRVVPRGLRSFGVADADFFPELLPGPRDARGLPEGLAFWLHRLEETEAERTFPVGLIYGPSGCGKSSLVKAGLLPRLGERVRSGLCGGDRPGYRSEAAQRAAKSLPGSA